MTEKREQIIGLYEEWKDCAKCKIGCIANRHVIFETIPKGLETLDILFIGEGPGMSEDTQGLPFVGASGKVIRTLIESAKPEGMTYGITNTVACRPTDFLGGPNRQPAEKEIENCFPRVEQLVKILEPKCIVLVGAIARNNTGIMLKRQGYSGPLKNLAHPASLLYDGGDKNPAKRDEQIEKIRGFFDLVRKSK